MTTDCETWPSPLLHVDAEDQTSHKVVCWAPSWIVSTLMIAVKPTRATASSSALTTPQWSDSSHEDMRQSAERRLNRSYGNVRQVLGQEIPISTGINQSWQGKLILERSDELKQSQWHCECGGCWGVTVSLTLLVSLALCWTLIIELTSTPTKEANYLALTLLAMT